MDDTTANPFRSKPPVKNYPPVARLGGRAVYGDPIGWRLAALGAERLSIRALNAFSAEIIGLITKKIVRGEVTPPMIEIRRK